MRKCMRIMILFFTYFSNIHLVFADSFYEDLLKEPVIRLFVGETSGLGHQSHTALIAKRLRQDGYKGVIEIVYTPGAEQKLKVFFPFFDYSQSDFFNEVNHLRFVRVDYDPIEWDFNYIPRHPLRHLPFVITGGEDSHWFRDHYIRDVLKAESLIVLNPQGWSAESYIQTQEGRRRELF